MLNMPPIALFDNLTHSNHPTTPYAKGLTKEGNDFLQAQAFLHRYRTNPKSYNFYRYELEVFLHWCWLVKGTTLPFITAADIHYFVEFCQSPPTSWCGSKKGVPRFLTVEGRRKPNPEWRPFITRPDGKLLSNKSVRELYHALILFFDYCALDRYVSLNPAKLAWREAQSIFKSDTKKIPPPPTLKTELWLSVLETVHQAAAEVPQVYERIFFIMNLMVGLYLKASDLTAIPEYSLSMGNFYQDEKNSWWFKIEMPGQLPRNILVKDTVLSALKRYRIYLKLTPLPEPNETTPLLSKQKGNGPITDTSSIRKMIKQAFELTRQKLKEKGLNDLAQELESAQVSSLRNMAVAADMNVRHPERVRQDTGYRSLGSLGRYQSLIQV